MSLDHQSDALSWKMRIGDWDVELDELSQTIPPFNKFPCGRGEKNLLF